MLLQGKDVICPIDHPDFKTKVAREERDAALEWGMIPMKRADWERAHSVCAAVETQLGRYVAEPPLLVDGVAEQAIVWEERGVLCRALLDWFRDDRTTIDDIKTDGRSANPLLWDRKTMWEYRYHVQAQFYRRGAHALTGVWPDFRFIIVESQHPHAVTVVTPGKRALELADEQIDHALDTWAQCLSTGEWPAYTNRVVHIDPPAYVESQWVDHQYLQEAA
jgi:hypothetical protein